MAATQVCQPLVIDMTPCIELNHSYFPLPHQGNGKWYRNIDYYRMDGSTSAATRKKWAEDFNDEINTRSDDLPARFRSTQICCDYSAS